jgi:hypothetical protein
MGPGVHTIEVGKTGNGALPTITRRVTIDGYTQLGATKNTLTQPGKTDASPKIVLDGAGVGAVVPGLHVSGSGASNCVVRGLVINGFFYGIALSNGTGHRIEGNLIGTDPDGTSAQANGTGVILQNADGSTIGGTSPDRRNLLDGVVAAPGSSGDKIQGNLIGTDKSGAADLGNDGSGVLISSSSNAAPISNNVIGDSDPTDGATNAANTIAFNTEAGIEMYPVSNGNRILSNSIYANGGLGIDLVGGAADANGVTANDPGDPDAGPNKLQNFPALTSATTFPTGTDIVGTLDSTPSTRRTKRTFTIQFFSSPQADSSGFGEGKTFLGETRVTTSRKGKASFGFSTQAVSEGEFVTATATRNRTGDTSEFSEARVVQGPVIGP